MNDNEKRVAIAVACGVPLVVQMWKHSYSTPSVGEVWVTGWRSLEAAKEDQLNAYRLSFKPVSGPVQYESPNPDIPDYLNSLDAMHEAEKTLTPVEHMNFWEDLIRLPERDTIAKRQPWLICSSTARQRAEAFGRTKGLWQ
jgi:hypothetical protein